MAIDGADQPARTNVGALIGRYIVYLPLAGSWSA
jgi:hypothetical protein